MFFQVFRALQVLLQGAPTRERGRAVPGEGAAEERGDEGLQANGADRLLRLRNDSQLQKYSPRTHGGQFVVHVHEGVQDGPTGFYTGN